MSAISPNVVILTREEMREREARTFNRGVECGRLLESMDQAERNKELPGAACAPSTGGVEMPVFQQIAAGGSPIKPDAGAAAGAVDGATKLGLVDRADREADVFSSKGDNFTKNLLREAAARIRELEAQQQTLIGLVRSSYNEGFGEGLKDSRPSSAGGKPWRDSKTMQRLFWAMVAPPKEWPNGQPRSGVAPDSDKGE